MLDTVIIGAGISGLTVAARLTAAGKKVRIIEKAPFAGGTMQTLREEGYIIDFGPNTLVLNNAKILEMIRYAGLEDRVCHAGPMARNRFIVKKGKLVPLPLGPLSFLGTPLFSPAAKLRLMKEPFIGNGPENESVAAFVKRRLGPEFFDYAVDPFISGVYAGDPHKLSVKWAVPKIFALQETYGSLVKGAVLGWKKRRTLRQTLGEQAKTRARICNFTQGISAFPRALAGRLGTSLSLESEVRNISIQDGQMSLEYSSPAGQVSERCATLVFSIPAYALDPLLKLADPLFPGGLGEMPYAPVAQVFLGFKKNQLVHSLNGFGLLFPQKEQSPILGALMNASMFSGRAPEGHTALTFFLGGTQHPEIIELDDRELIRICHEELGKLMPVSGEAQFLKIRKWDRAIPQYHLDYPRFLGLMEGFEKRNRGMFLSGNFRGGISVGDCLSQSYSTAEKIIAFLDNIAHG